MSEIVFDSIPGEDGNPENPHILIMKDSAGNELQSFTFETQNEMLAFMEESYKEFDKMNKKPWWKFW
jgi:hypothetical protein